MSIILVVDLEATCWENEVPDGQYSEIIEIGICPIDTETNTVLREEGASILVKPNRSTVSAFCTQLTGHTQDELEKHGVPLAYAFNKLDAVYKSTKTIWAGWGDYDRKKIADDAYYTGERNPMSKQHINVKALHAAVHGLPKGVGMDRALMQMGLPLAGRHHNGFDDACNIANILSVFLGKSRLL